MPEATGVELIAKERQRQIEQEGWDPENDDGHVKGEMAMAACCYASPLSIYIHNVLQDGFEFMDPWPWMSEWDKRVYCGSHLMDNRQIRRKDRIDLLIKAGALIAAEIDRLNRIEDRLPKKNAEVQCQTD